MTEKIPGTSENIPKWDIALAALAREAWKKKGEALRIDDFLQLAADHSIRFDDIMVTMFELVLQNKWSYKVADGTKTNITRDEVNNLYVNGRLNEADVRDYIGLWQPLG